MTVVPASPVRGAAATSTPRSRLAVALVAAVLGLTGCSSDSGGDASGAPAGPATSDEASTPDAEAVNEGAVKQDGAPALADSPELGACRVLTPADVEKASNDVDTVDCGDQHTAQTFVVGSFPEKVTRGTGWGSPKLGRYIYGECTDRFGAFVGGDESIVMRSLVSWAWFRPTQEQWSDGARWFRCDIVGGTPVASSYAALPETAKGLFARGPVQKWMQCVQGRTIASAPASPCSTEHDWRALSTVKVGEPDEDYPGDDVVESRSRDRCSTSVSAMLGYPETYDFAFSWFHEAEWKTGNRRSVCWAKTEA